MQCQCVHIEMSNLDYFVVLSCQPEDTCAFFKNFLCGLLDHCKDPGPDRTSVFIQQLQLLGTCTSVTGTFSVSSQVLKIFLFSFKLFILFFLYFSSIHPKTGTKSHLKNVDLTLWLCTDFRLRSPVLQQPGWWSGGRQVS